MDHYLQELSYDKINLAGSEVAGWYDLPDPLSAYQVLDHSKECYAAVMPTWIRRGDQQRETLAARKFLQA
jgi:hypothetical protein